MIDSYMQFFSIIPKETFFDFGIRNIIYSDKGKSFMEWKALKQKIYGKHDELYVRASGRNGAGNKILSSLYKDIFGLNIKFDPTNNQKPTITIQELTGHKKNKTIQNYQVSHVFGRTKNVFCFTAPWNIIFIPKLIDPLTGHEAKGAYVQEFQKLLTTRTCQLFRDQIEEYNHEMDLHKDNISKWINSNVEPKLRESIKKDFDLIDINAC